MTLFDALCDLNERSIGGCGAILAIVIIALLATAYFCYMAGYYDGYHAGAVIYMESLP